MYHSTRSIDTNRHALPDRPGSKEVQSPLSERREWDSNPRRVAPHTLSKRADSAALASLLERAIVPDWFIGESGANSRRESPTNAASGGNDRRSVASLAHASTGRLAGLEVAHPGP